MRKLYYSQRGDHIESTDPVTVSRYRGFTRANHWVTALSLIVLLLSGMALFSPYDVERLYGKPFGDIAVSEMYAQLVADERVCKRWIRARLRLLGR